MRREGEAGERRDGEMAVKGLGGDIGEGGRYWGAEGVEEEVEQEWVLRVRAEGGELSRREHRGER